MKFLVPNYSCLQNHWLGGYRPQIPVQSVLCPQLKCWTPAPRKNFLGTPLTARLCRLNWFVASFRWRENSTHNFEDYSGFRVLQHAVSQIYSEVSTNDHDTPLQPRRWEIETPKMHQYAPHILIKLACKSITYRSTYLTGTVWNCYWENLPRGNSTFCRRPLIFHLTVNCRVVHSLQTHGNSPSTSRYAVILSNFLLSDSWPDNNRIATAHSVHTGAIKNNLQAVPH